MAPQEATANGQLTPDDPSKVAGVKRRTASQALDKVDSDSEEDEAHCSERELAKKKWVKRLDWLWRKITAAFWVGCACFMIWWTNFFRVIWESPLVNRTYFNLALACLGFNMSMLAYLAIWCAWIKGIPEPWEKHNPKAIPVMAVVGFSTVWLFFFALWPVWGFLTLVIEFVFFLGFLSAGHFLPSGNAGSVLMFVIFFGAFFTSELIPHEGLAHYTPRPSFAR
eukprot:CAMPEP_0171071548 /NCGR_PEP_ID=MMETSP0766_2-20121228/10384_1 /TAXON_ID=439317 /ORGANISM="Gambierdiscus australes, Strain CAWD 149" /LENGTH=223 /DNA_ID=CAMNT_0011528097 /DNA_START=28 /DNA_END=699 /DNA_ORIENTATION=+